MNEVFPASMSRLQNKGCFDELKCSSFLNTIEWCFSTYEGIIIPESHPGGAQSTKKAQFIIFSCIRFSGM